MTDNDFWDCPPEQGIAQYGEFRLTLIERPFPVGGSVLPAHDPARAREFAAAFGTIDTVVEEVDRIEATERPPFATRADLDLVSVGCWGTVTEVNDPALVFTGGTFPLAEQADELAERFPGAVIIGSATIDYSVTYGTHVIYHPDGARLFAAGWSGERDWDREGTPQEVINAFGIGPDALERADIDLDAHPGAFPWEGLTRLALQRVTPLLRKGRTLSVFRVRHTEEATGDLEDTWIGEFDEF
ncbi:DUF6333 family protein [Streptomyces gobiensis]|uniref:DUF6333 family protein n=1 Tax=Streptomyces gobiensis TaxID=2875706 RepID=UPI001E4B85D6|nr:DUF6333 family protein [Streptomyces gobiensis]UGY93059.1 DUF6333 family protein [Streptomyces gobiensis]